MSEIDVNFSVSVYDLQKANGQYLFKKVETLEAENDC